jgi:predicted O-methyltransferase YrrM
VKSFDVFIEDIYRLYGMGRCGLAHSWSLVLYSLVKALRPKHALEVGVFMGMTSIWLARALEEIGGGRLSLVDDWSAYYGPVSEAYLRETLSVALSHPVDGTNQDGLDVRIYSMPSGQYFPMETEPVEFAFIDGDHSEGGLEKDLAGVLPLLAPRAVVCLHDTNEDRFPACAAKGRDKKWLNDHNLEAINLWPDAGLTILVTKWAGWPEDCSSITCGPDFDGMRRRN